VHIQIFTDNFVENSSALRINPLPEETPHGGIVQVKVDISLKNKTIYGVPEKALNIYELFV